jgi:group II intron reverse transcriptase/maturase
MQKRLSGKATQEPEHRFEDLYSLLCNEVWLRAAHNNVNSNQGRETAGIDGETMRTFNGNLNGNLEALQEALKAKTFEPAPVRRVYIPKANGKKRPIGIPTIKDRIVQEALRMILEPIWEASFHVRSYGFRPNRSTYDAISYLSNRLADNGGRSYQWVIEGDITSYFDTIPHRRLIKAINKKVADKNIRDLLWMFLRAGVMARDDLTETLTGTPQGGIISPLLANIYLHNLDMYMESKYLSLTHNERKGRRKRGQGNYLYIRYADDFIVLCNGTKSEAQTMKEEVSNVLKDMGLKLSEEKTKLTHITEGFTFLGYRIIREIGDRGKMVPKVETPESAIKKFRHKVREITSPQTTHESTNAKILALNNLIRGWCNYYCITSSPSGAFNQVRPEVFWGFAHWLGRKYKENMPGIMQKYRIGNSLGTAQRRLEMPTEYKAKKRLVKTWHNPYTEKEAVEREKERLKREILFTYKTLWNGNSDRRPAGMDLREEALLRDGTTCARCKKSFHAHEVHADHVVPRAKFKDPTDADKLENIQILCNDCHRAKTKTDLEVLSRMR